MNVHKSVDDPGPGNDSYLVIRLFLSRKEIEKRIFNLVYLI